MNLKSENLLINENETGGNTVLNKELKK